MAQSGHHFRGYRLPRALTLGYKLANSRGKTMHDPVLLEVIKNAMGTIAEEIGIVAVRSAYSTAVKESADASAAVCDCAGQVIAQSLGAPLMHLSSLAGPRAS